MAEAAKWYRLADEQGHAAVQWARDALYENGQGVHQDYVQAHMWYKVGPAQELEITIKERDEWGKKMTPKQITEAQRLARE